MSNSHSDVLFFILIFKSLLFKFMILSQTDHSLAASRTSMWNPQWYDRVARVPIKIENWNINLIFRYFYSQILQINQI